MKDYSRLTQRHDYYKQGMKEKNVKLNVQVQQKKSFNMKVII